MPYLIDTNIIVYFTRGSGNAADYLELLGAACSIASLTALEVIAGARDQEEIADLDILLSLYPRIPAGEEISRRAYYLMKTYSKPSGLGTIDAVIAATALENGLTLSTKNRKHFAMITDLRLDVPAY